MRPLNEVTPPTRSHQQKHDIDNTTAICFQVGRESFLAAAASRQGIGSCRRGDVILSHDQSAKDCRPTWFFECNEVFFGGRSNVLLIFFCMSFSTFISETEKRRRQVRPLNEVTPPTRSHQQKHDIDNTTAICFQVGRESFLAAAASWQGIGSYRRGDVISSHDLTDSRGVDLYFSFHKIEASVQARLMLSDHELVIFSEEYAEKITIETDALGEYLACIFKLYGAESKAEIHVHPEIKVRWYTFGSLSAR